MIELKQQLLIPLAFWIGFNQQYIGGLFHLERTQLQLVFPIIVFGKHWVLFTWLF